MCGSFPTVHMLPFVKCSMSTLCSVVPFVWVVSKSFCEQCRSGFRPTDRRLYFGPLLKDLGATSLLIQIQLSVLLVHVFPKVH